MRNGALYRLQGQAPLLDKVRHTETPLERMRGLLWRAPLQTGEGLIIDHCRSVHTCGMNYALDLVFLDRQWAIKKLVRGIRPWRMAGCFAACATLELPAGSVDKLDLQIGMRLLWRETVTG
jgi:uncharacterized membrane protein (UPF0127 family)